MDNFSDLLSGAFSETAVPSFTEGDLDFENLDFEGKYEDDETDQTITGIDETLLQEATGETTASLGKEHKDLLSMADNVYKEPADEETDEEDFMSVSVSSMSMKNTPQEEDYTSSSGESEEEDSVSGDDEEEDEDEENAGRPGDLKEDRIFAERRPLTPEPSENPQVINREQGEAEGDEELSYFGNVPEQSLERTIKGAAIEEEESEEEKQEDSSDPESDCKEIGQEENTLDEQLERGIENLDGPGTARLQFPRLSLQNLQDLVAEVNGEEGVEKMKDFSGEEHQEAGESFADYPSDFSSCEYVEDGGRKHDSQRTSNNSSGASDYVSSPQRDSAVVDVEWASNVEDLDTNKIPDLELNPEELMSQDVADGEEDERKTETVGLDDWEEKGESDSYSSSDEGFPAKSNDEEPSDKMDELDLKNMRELEEARPRGVSSAVFSSVVAPLVTNSGLDPADFVSWDFDVLKSERFLSDLTTEDVDMPETLLPEDVNSYSVVQREETTAMSSSSRGSVDDSFFFNADTETSGATEAEQLGDDEYEGETNWEQEQERIKAFYEYYDDSDEDNERQERQIKVQFCADPLSQVIHYDTDSSDRDSLSSSSDGEQDLNSADTLDELEVPEDMQETKPECHPPNTQLPDTAGPDLRYTQTGAGQHWCVSMLKLLLKTGLVTVAGLLMFWLATDQVDGLSLLSFFN